MKYVPAAFLALLLLISAAVFAHNGGLLIGGTTTTPPPPPGGIACGVGPNYSGTIPAGAAAAGFTTCALNADFTSSAYSNKATFVNECGATTQFRWYWHQYISSPALNCSDISVVADTGVSPTLPQVLYINYPPSEFNSGGNANGAGFTWPGVSYTDCTSVPCLPTQFYVEVAYRTTFNSWSQGGGSTSGHTAWDAPGVGEPFSYAGNQFFEADFFESNGGPGSSFGGGLVGGIGGFYNLTSANYVNGVSITWWKHANSRHGVSNARRSGNQ